MKTEAFATLLLLTAVGSYGQGTTFFYDQQSSTNEAYGGYGGGPVLQTLLPSAGQSFTPTLSGIDFVRLSISDGNPGDGLGSTWFLNLRSGGINGAILGTTASVDLPDGFTGYPNFFFPNTIPLTPGTTYWFDVNSPNGGTWNIVFAAFQYPGGDGWVRGAVDPAGDFWFREGIMVPEPSSAALLVLGGLAVACLRHSRRK